MPIIKVDVTDIIANVTRNLPSRKDIDEVRRNVAYSALAFWKKQAQEGLKSSARDYVQALSYREQGSRSIITLSGQVPNLIEQGFPGGDMRDWMLKGPNAKMGKNGMYNTVPFRHGTPSSGGRNVGPPMPRAIYNAVLKLKTSKSRPDLKNGWVEPPKSRNAPTVLYGQRLSPDMEKVTKRAKELLTTKKKPWHTASIYLGMQREEKTYEGDTQHKYTSFRRISRNRNSAKDPETGEKRDNWMHPGIKPRHYADKTRVHVEKMLPDAIRMAMMGPTRNTNKR